MFYLLFGDNHNYSVSNQIAELGVQLLGNDCDEVYAPFSNSFNFAYFTDKKIYAESMADELIIELMKIFDGVNIDFVYTDTLETPGYINQNAPHLLRQFSCSLSFPPMGLATGKALNNEDKFNRFRIHKGKSHRDVAHVEHILAQTKSKAVILLPVGMTYRAGAEFELRKYLIENNLLEAIIQLPSNLHNETSIETTFFVINKNKKDTNVYFLNLKDKRFLSKDGRKTIISDPKTVIDLFEKQKQVENISGLISKEMIVQNDYTLSIDRYIISKEASKIKEQLSKYELVELQDIADVKRSQLFKDEGEGTDIYEVSPSDLAKSGFTRTGGKVKYIDKQINKLSTYMLEAFDIVVSTKGTIGKVGIVVPENNYLVASQAMQVIRLKDPRGGAPHRLYMYLKSNIGQSLLKQLVAGAAMPQISTAEIKKLKVPLLSEEEEDLIMDNYNKEIELYKELEKIENNIEQIHNNFLGNK
jgi:type I restriction enzyme M protein